MTVKPPKECPAAPILNGLIFMKNESPGVKPRSSISSITTDASWGRLRAITSKGSLVPLISSAWVLPTWFGAATMKPWLASVSTRTIDWMAKPPEPWEKMIKGRNICPVGGMSSTATAESRPIGPSSE